MRVAKYFSLSVLLLSSTAAFSDPFSKTGGELLLADRDTLGESERLDAWTRALDCSAASPTVAADGRITADRIADIVDSNPLPSTLAYSAAVCNEFRPAATINDDEEMLRERSGIRESIPIRFGSQTGHRTMTQTPGQPPFQTPPPVTPPPPAIPPVDPRPPPLPQPPVVSPPANPPINQPPTVVPPPPVDPFPPGQAPPEQSPPPFIPPISNPRPPPPPVAPPNLGPPTFFTISWA